MYKKKIPYVYTLYSNIIVDAYHYLCFLELKKYQLILTLRTLIIIIK